ncbi:hypothetical protein TcasGA2_TC005654 [Tribolium castaneum]|uniref:Uncharacterized protein n=1 Tax=Tribolium castaneum TaxID=7070 RepID=D6WX15_TRICA|nr:hypothetical protein TcasGA2_TC005654 [Tribolium castaneum]
MKEEFKKPAFYFKLIVAILCLVAVILWSAETETYGESGVATHWRHHHELIVVTTAGYLIIMLVFLIVYLFDSTEHMFELLFLFIGFVLCLASAIYQFIVGIKHEGNFAVFLLAACVTANAIIMGFDFFREMK